MQANSMVRIAGSLVDFSCVELIMPGIVDGELVLYFHNGENIIVSKIKHPIDYAALEKFSLRAPSAVVFFSGNVGGKNNADI
jgi:hypothetical protein